MPPLNRHIADVDVAFENWLRRQQHQDWLIVFFPQHVRSGNMYKLVL
jgi:hypothetical protein